MTRFSLSREPLLVVEASAALLDPSAGACVSFEGRVRNHADGRAVLRLEYEAYEALAVKEGERILAEAVARFGVTRVLCAHRLGVLAVGEIAVWVGAASAHRDAAFAACRYVIDEVKQRVPIWKKEFFADGDSGWVNCAVGAPQAADRPPHVALQRG